MTGLLGLFSDLISVITIFLCLILKVPQILRLFKTSRGTGLSLKGILLELSSYTVTMMYNYCNSHALLSYLEYPVLILQDYAIIGLLLFYQKHNISTFLGLLLIHEVICVAFAYNFFQKNILNFFLPLTTPIGAVSKALQLIEILKKKNADSVSSLTWFLSLFTNVTRIFTVYMDSADFNLLLNFSVSSVLSGSVLCSVIYYQKVSKRNEKKTQ